MLKYLPAFLLLTAFTLYSQLYQGPASGSVSSGVIVSTDNFNFSNGPEIPPYLQNRVIPRMPDQIYPSYMNNVKPTGPVGSNEVLETNSPINHGNGTSDVLFLKSYQGFNDPGSYIPPDQYMAVGPQHVIGVDNGRFRIWDKNTGYLLKSISAAQWFSTVLPGAGPFDPKISYDHFNKRFVMVWDEEVDPPNQRAYYLIAVSKDSIPLGNWYCWAIKSSLNGSSESGQWADYEGVGFDANAIYITGRMFQYLGNFQGCKFRIIDKANLYANTAGQLTWTDLWSVRDPNNLSVSPDVLRPTIVYGTPSEYYFMGAGAFGSGSSLNVYKLTNPITNPVMTGVDVSVTAFVAAGNAQQLGGGLLVEAGGSFLRNEPVYRNGFLYATHSVWSSSGGSNINYTKINVSTNTAVEDIAFGSPSFFHYYPAIAVNQNQDLLITYSRSSSTEYIGAFFAYKLNSDPPGLTGSVPIQVGKANYVKDFNSGRNRWGDYMGCWLDPSDQTSFWTLTEYAETPANTWGVWAANIRLNPYPGGHVYTRADSIIFGQAEVNTASDTASFNIYNYGTDTLSISNLAVQTANYAIVPAGNFPIKLHSLDSTTIRIVFKPTVAGILMDTLRISSNDPGNPVKKVSLKGSGFVINPVTGGLIYGVTTTQDNGVLITINPATGVGSNVGSTTYSSLAGITVRPSTAQLYATYTGSSNTSIVRVNATGGDAHLFVNVPITSIRALAFDANDVLYAASITGTLYTINLTNGNATQIGSTGISFLYSLSINPINGQLWGVSAISGLYKIDKTSGASTLVGTTGFSFVPSITFNLSGKGYGVSGSGSTISNLFSFDTSNATGTSIGSTGFHVNAIAFARAPIGIKPISTIVPDKYSLYQNYPNPFNPTTKIDFDVLKKGLVTISVYDILGRELETIVNENMEPGKYSYTFKGDNLASGIYFYRIRVNDFSAVKKMLLLK